MRALVFSDVHGNLEALEAVLAAGTARGFDEAWNLGDVVGYGASPNAVVERVRSVAAVHVRGNHDRVCCGLSSPNGFNPVAREAALWTRQELSAENTAWLRDVPQGPVQPEHAPEASCAHGSPLDEDHYILNMRDAWAPLQQSATAVTFFGHTHVQGGFSQREHNWHELRPRMDAGEGEAAWVLELEPGTRQLINPGSVGQPRDRDWRAAFAIYDTEAARVTYCRVPYDVMAAQGRILMAELPERLAARLREGR